MKSATPKVLHQVAGRSMLSWVQTTAKELGAERMITVLGPESEHLEVAGEVVVQRERRGTGHAVQISAPHLEGFEGWVLVLYGDTALIRPETLRDMLTAGEQAGADLMVTGFEPQDPAKYGRLVVEKGALKAIVEFKDADEDQRALGLCNGGLMALRAPRSLPLLDRLSDDNAAGELYLTDMVELVNADGGTCLVHSVPEEEVKGVNTRQELAEVEALMQARLRRQHMLAGVTLQDPSTVYFSYDTEIGQDTVLEPHQVFGPGVKIGSNVTIKASCHFEKAQVADHAVLGPFARLRPGTIVEAGAKIGNFVETKNAHLAEGAKVNHLSYVGDATVGEGANVGAGTITCNYDGFNKHQTEIGAGAFIGSNTALVAPIRIGDGAIVGAGSTLTKDVPDQDLALTRAKPQQISGGAARLRKKLSKS